MSELLIAPSILAADFGNIQREVEMLNKSEADYLHIDIMDGVFVPNISFGFPVCESIYKHSQKPMDFHLMIKDATPYLALCKQAGARVISVHAESSPHLHRTIDAIKKLGCKAGVALNPHTSVQALEDIVSDIDLLLIMSVNPGFGGQKFIENTYQKVARAKELITKENSNAMIEVDGGVNLENAVKLKDAGADILVAGSTVFQSSDPQETIKKLKSV